MNLFRRLFSSDEKQRANAPVDRDAKLFDDEWYNAVRRFGVVAGFRSIDFTSRHPQTNELMSPHEGLAGIFHDWKEISDPWDRRHLLFDQIY
jgi:hypothetical protein